MSKAIEIKYKILSTTIPCPQSTAYGGDCCGCLIAEYRAVEDVWIFCCNECSCEVGQGIIKIRKWQQSDGCGCVIWKQDGICYTEKCHFHQKNPQAFGGLIVRK